MGQLDFILLFINYLLGASLCVLGASNTAVKKKKPSPTWSLHSRTCALYGRAQDLETKDLGSGLALSPTSWKPWVRIIMTFSFLCVYGTFYGTYGTASLISLIDAKMKENCCNIQAIWFGG